MIDKKFVPQFNVTLRCNMYNICKYCYVKEQAGKFPLDLDCVDFANILDWFIMLDVDELILLGGEPTLHRDINKMISFFSCIICPADRLPNIPLFNAYK